MSFLSPRSRPTSARRETIGCRRCGERITLADQIRKDGDGFAHLSCVAVDTAVPAQRSS